MRLTNLQKQLNEELDLGQALAVSKIWITKKIRVHTVFRTPIFSALPQMAGSKRSWRFQVFATSRL